MITLHQFETSPFCDKIRRILNVKERHYDMADISMAQMLRGAIKKLNPTGKLPVLDIDGEQFCDSTTIAYELERRYPQPPLIPKDPREKALVHILEDWADESLYFYELHLRFAVTRNAGKWVDSLTQNDAGIVQKVMPKVLPRALKSVTKTQGIGRKSISIIQDDITRHVESLDGMLQTGHWLVGSSLTLADISVYCQIACIYSSAEGKSIIDQFPRLLDWMHRVDISTRGMDASN